MSERISTIKMLKEARNKVISRAAAAERLGNIDEKVRWEQRRTVLDEELVRIQMLGGDLPPKRIFISYSTNSGLNYFQFLKKLLEESNFEVVDGFRETRGTEGNVLKMVLRQLKESTLYLAILSKEIRVQHGRHSRWAPGVWVSEEKGMALALEKPFLLLINQEIHDDFWRKTTPEKHHVFFADSDFHQRAEEVVTQANDRYDEYLLKHTIRFRE